MLLSALLGLQALGWIPLGPESEGLEELGRHEDQFCLERFCTVLKATSVPKPSQVLSMHACMHVSTHACTHVSMYACMYICLHVHMYIDTHTCTYMFTYTYFKVFVYHGTDIMHIHMCLEIFATTGLYS